MPRYAIVNADNVVENIILWDGASSWQPPEGRILINVEDKMCDIGWSHDNGNFVDPNPVQAQTPQE